MKKLAAALALSLVASLAAADSWTGGVTDSHCGKGKAKPGTTVAQVEMCVKGGATWQLWDEKTDKGFGVDDPAKLRPFTGKKIKVTGTLDPKTNVIKVENVEWVKGS